MQDVLKFILDNYLILVPVIGILGYGIKNTALIADKYIPIILITVGGLLGLAMAIQLNQGVFDGIIQGILCGGLAIGINQVPKQLSKSE